MVRNVNISTPENVNIKYETAGIGSRLIAMFIDTLIQIGIYIVLVLVIIGLFSTEVFNSNVMLGIAIVSYFVINTFYFIVFEKFFKGQTPGKKAARIKVLSITGEPANTFMILVRNLFRIVDSLPANYLAGMLASLFNKRNQRIGDIVANTMVVKVRSQADAKQLIQDILHRAEDETAPEPVIDDMIVKTENNAYFPVNERQYRNLKKYLETRLSFTRYEDYDYLLFRYYNSVTGGKVANNLLPYYKIVFLNDIIKQNAQYYE